MRTTRYTRLRTALLAGAAAALLASLSAPGSDAQPVSSEAIERYLRNNDLAPTAENLNRAFRDLDRDRRSGRDDDDDDGVFGSSDDDGDDGFDDDDDDGFDDDDDDGFDDDRGFDDDGRGRDDDDDGDGSSGGDSNDDDDD